MPCATLLLERAVIESAQDRWEALKGSPETRLSPVENSSRSHLDRPHTQNVSVKGVPKTAVVAPAGARVFRNYLPAAALEKTLATQRLPSALTPYCQVSPGHERKIFENVTGLFLTFPQFSPDGLLDTGYQEMAFVDFQLAPETPVLQLEPGISVVPLPKRYPAWIVEKCTAFRSGISSGDSSIDSMCQTLLEEGADFTQVAEVPIQIIASGKYDPASR